MPSSVNLTAFPGHFSEGFLSDAPTLRNRLQARCFSKEKYVHSVNLVRNHEGNIDVDGQVHRSQRKNEQPHSVHFSLDTEKILDASCSCKAGISGKCSHTLAVIMTIQDWILEGYKDIPADPSCTSLPQEWHKPRGAKIVPEPVSQMVIVQTNKMSRKRKPVMPVLCDNRKVKIDPKDQDDLRALTGCPISYLAQDCLETVNTGVAQRAVGSGLSYQEPLFGHHIGPAEVTSHCGDVTFPKNAPILCPESFVNHQQNWAHLSISLQDAKDLEGQTRQQAGNQSWFDARKKRITASKFGMFIKRRIPMNQKFLGNMFQKNVNVKATQYGTATEKIAKVKYTETQKCHVHSVGLVVNPAFPFLGASPDGIVCDNGECGLLEIKCPISVRDCTIPEACKKAKSFCLRETSDGIRLKPNHDYMYQVQGQLLVTGAPFCDFMVYTHEDVFIQRVLPDKDHMTNMLEKLGNIYCDHVKSYLDSI